MMKLLIHIGYHKTATSWLQARLFNNTEIGFTSTHQRHAVPRPIVAPHALDFDADACREYFLPALQQALQSDLIPVLSHERLSGEIHIGGRDNKEIADRLYATFPEAHILIIIREQKSMLKSIYGQFVKGSGVWSLQDYLIPPIAEKKRFKYALFDRNHFRYHRLIAHYQQRFGSNKVTVIPYELFVHQPAEFCRQIVQTVGLPFNDKAITSLPYDERINDSLSAAGVAVKRQFNRVIGKRTPFNTTPLLPFQDPKRITQRCAFFIDQRLPNSWKDAADQRMHHEIEAAVAGYYAESNCLTENLTDLDLAAFGYEVGEIG